MGDRETLRGDIVMNEREIRLSKALSRRRINRLKPRIDNTNEATKIYGGRSRNNNRYSKRRDAEIANENKFLLGKIKKIKTSKRSKKKNTFMWKPDVKEERARVSRFRPNNFDEKKQVVSSPTFRQKKPTRRKISPRKKKIRPVHRKLTFNDSQSSLGRPSARASSSNHSTPRGGTPRALQQYALQQKQSTSWLNPRGVCIYSQRGVVVGERSSTVSVYECSFPDRFEVVAVDDGNLSRRNRIVFYMDALRDAFPDMPILLLPENTPALCEVLTKSLGWREDTDARLVLVAHSLKNIEVTSTQSSFKPINSPLPTLQHTAQPPDTASSSRPHSRGHSRSNSRPVSASASRQGSPHVASSSKPGSPQREAISHSRIVHIIDGLEFVIYVENQVTPRVLNLQMSHESSMFLVRLFAADLDRLTARLGQPLFTDEMSFSASLTLVLALFAATRNETFDIVHLTFCGKEVPFMEYRETPNEFKEDEDRARARNQRLREGEHAAKTIQVKYRHHRKKQAANKQAFESVEEERARKLAQLQELEEQVKTIQMVQQKEEKQSTFLTAMDSAAFDDDTQVDPDAEHRAAQTIQVRYRHHAGKQRRRRVREERMRQEREENNAAQAIQVRYRYHKKASSRKRRAEEEAEILAQQAAEEAMQRQLDQEAQEKERARLEAEEIAREEEEYAREQAEMEREQEEEAQRVERAFEASLAAEQARKAAEERAREEAAEEARREEERQKEMSRKLEEDRKSHELAHEKKRHHAARTIQVRYKYYSKSQKRRAIEDEMNKREEERRAREAEKAAAEAEAVEEAKRLAEEAALKERLRKANEAAAELAAAQQLENARVAAEEARLREKAAEELRLEEEKRKADEAREAAERERQAREAEEEAQRLEEERRVAKEAAEQAARDAEKQREEEWARAKAEAEARAAAEEEARLLAEQIRREEEERAQQAALERAKLDKAEAEARAAAEEEARLLAEQIRREEEERAQQAALERAKLDKAEAEARAAAEEEARLLAEQIRREEEERAQQAALERAKLEAEARAAAEKEARLLEEQVKREQEEIARLEALELERQVQAEQAEIARLEALVGGQVPNDVNENAHEGETEEEAEMRREMELVEAEIAASMAELDELEKSGAVDKSEMGDFLHQLKEDTVGHHHNEEEANPFASGGSNHMGYPDDDSESSASEDKPEASPVISKPLAPPPFLSTLTPKKPALAPMKLGPLASPIGPTQSMASPLTARAPLPATTPTSAPVAANHMEYPSEDEDEDESDDDLSKMDPLSHLSEDVFAQDDIPTAKEPAVAAKTDQDFAVDDDDDDFFSEEGDPADEEPVFEVQHKHVRSPTPVQDDPDAVDLGSDSEFEF